jgi:regulatory protein
MGFARPRKLGNEAELYQYAVGALGRRMRSVAELKRLLRRRVEEDTEIGQTLVELVIRRLKDQGYLSDAKYAEAYSAFRRDNEKFGRRRVVTDLKVKGVHGEVIEAAMESTFGEVNEEKQARDSADFSSVNACGVWGEDDLWDFEEVGSGGGSD